MALYTSLSFKWEGHQHNCSSSPIHLNGTAAISGSEFLPFGGNSTTTYCGSLSVKKIIIIHFRNKIISYTRNAKTDICWQTVDIGKSCPLNIKALNQLTLILKITNTALCHKMNKTKKNLKK